MIDWDLRYSTLPASLLQRVSPTPLPAPYPVAWNETLARELGIEYSPGESPEMLALLAGNLVPEGIAPVATAYAGHQFGSWVPELGDGRAIMLGMIRTPAHASVEVQLKGAGLTRFSRMGDGRAVLRSTIREYLASEAMHGLGIPTTRALAIVGSDLPVYRETTETAAVLTRTAPSLCRFGTFEYLTAHGMLAEREVLAEQLITDHHPALLALPKNERYPAWFGGIVERTARLMAMWMAAGFAHGVMNTDNFSVLGLTMDYGPYGWMERYDPAWICNHSDHTGRYAFDRQPSVGLWNCTRFAESLHGMVSREDAIELLNRYAGVYQDEMLARMRAKLGLAEEHEEDVDLIADLLSIMQEGKADYTRTFRALSHWRVTDIDLTALPDWTGSQALIAWLDRYRERLSAEAGGDDDRRQRMLAVNPKYVLRNWIAQNAIDNAEHRNFGLVDELRRLFERPFDEHPTMERFAVPAPDDAPPVVVSCSS